MADENARIDRLAERAKELDDMIRKAAATQKRIVKELRRLGRANKPVQVRHAAPRKRRKPPPTRPGRKHR